MFCNNIIISIVAFTAQFYKYLFNAARFDEILFEHIVNNRVKFSANIFN